MIQAFQQRNQQVVGRGPELETDQSQNFALQLPTDLPRMAFRMTRIPQGNLETDHREVSGMLGKRSSQRSLFDVEYHFRQLMGEDSFHWQLSQVRDQLFREVEFAALYCLDNGRPSMLPSLLVMALLLQAHDKVSDAEAHRRARLDLGWKVALRVEANAKSFAQSTLQQFRVQLILHDRIQVVFLRNLELTREKAC